MTLLSRGRLALVPVAVFLSWPSACTAVQPKSGSARPASLPQPSTACRSLACAMLS